MLVRRSGLASWHGRRAAPVTGPVAGVKWVKPEIGIRAVLTKQVACDVLPLRIYGLTHFQGARDRKMGRAKRSRWPLCPPPCDFRFPVLRSPSSEARMRRVDCFP